MSVKKKKQIEYELIGNIELHSGHSVWEINTLTMEVKKAKFTNVTYKWGEKNKPEIIVNPNCVYVGALNKKNALEKYKKGQSGSKPVSNFKMSIDLFK